MGRSSAEIYALHRSKTGAPMSALGQKQIFRDVQLMSALPPKADMVQHDRDVRFVPLGDVTPSTRDQ
jgi:hypothetical protein